MPAVVDEKMPVAEFGEFLQESVLEAQRVHGELTTYTGRLARVTQTLGGLVDIDLPIWTPDNADPDDPYRRLGDEFIAANAGKIHAQGRLDRLRQSVDDNTRGVWVNMTRVDGGYIDRDYPFDSHRTPALSRHKVSGFIEEVELIKGEIGVKSPGIIRSKTGHSNILDGLGNLAIILTAYGRANTP